MGFVSDTIATVALWLKQSLPAFCDIETSDGPYLLSKRGEYLSVIEINGLCRMPNQADIDYKVEALRIDLQGLFDYPGHGIQAWYATDPAMAMTMLEDLLALPRAMARELDLDLDDILSERTRTLPKLMRWERCYFVLWSRRPLLTRDEERIAEQERAKMSENSPPLRGTQTQNVYLATELLATKHRAFVQRVVSALESQQISTTELEPHDALIRIREALYPETHNSNWKPILPGDHPRPRMPDGPVRKNDFSFLLWPTLPSQIFYDDAITEGLRIVTMGHYEWTSIEVVVGPEDTRPFAELVAKLAAINVPWRISMWVEGGGGLYSTLKATFATMLAFDPTNRSVMTAFENLKQMKLSTGETSVRWRCALATWAPLGERSMLRRNAAMIAQRVQSWGNIQTGMLSGDPLESLMGSALGLSFGSPSPAGTAPLSHALRMMPWSRPASPWPSGAVLFRAPDGKIFPYDPSGSGQGAKFRLVVAPPRFGKSTLQNCVNLGLCLSSASQGALGARLPLIGKIDIGDSAEGMILLLRDALPYDRRDEALYIRMQFRHGFEFNIFETQLGCRAPLRNERAFIENFLNLVTLSDSSGKTFEGMTQFVKLVIDEVYRLFGDSGENTIPKTYAHGIEPAVDQAIAELELTFESETPWWWEIVDALCAHDRHHTASLAQRHALPIIEDLITASRSDQVKTDYQYQSEKTSENLTAVFERYVKALIREIPTLNRPTSLDFGKARVVVLDLQEVAPSGNNASAVRTTSLMYMLARHILARNFFLHRDDLSDVPEHMKAWHEPRFREITEVLKLLDYDEYHRTKASPPVRAQVNRDLLEGGKHNVQISVTSQSISHFDDDLIKHSNERFILGAGDATEADMIADRFNLADSSRYILHHRLRGPDRNGGGAPFLLVTEAYNTKYEQMLVNSLGPSELWALSTTPMDVHLRNRLYLKLGPPEARRRLAAIFPNGTADAEIRRRKDARIMKDTDETRVELGVADEIADELFNAHGVASGLKGKDLRNLEQAAQ